MLDLPCRMARTVVIATGNPHKVDEMRELFAAARLDLQLLSLIDAASGRPLHEPEETGTSFIENAQIKAISYAQQTGELCLADDSGLEIDALGGKPGVISSHYSTDGRETGMSRQERDRANNQRVLGELAGVPLEQRSARFVCVMCLAEPVGADGRPAVIARARSVMEGRIGEPPRVPAGENGFGYDPLFLVAPSYEQTGAELTATAKNALSHRGAAARRMAEQMRALLNV